jgi:hypothetical protein
MTQKRQIGDPLELAATTGKIGKKQAAGNSDTQTFEGPNLQMPESSGFQTPESLNTQTSESLNFQTSKLSKDQIARSPEGQKSKHRGREQQTIYLPPHLVRKLKMYKALHDKDYSDIVTEALEEYFHSHQE